MYSSNKPTWLKDPEGLSEIAKYNLFMPQEASNFTSLQDSDAFVKGMKQFLYWKGQLTPSLKENTVFLAFLGPNGLCLPNVINVSKALKSFCDFSLLIETHIGANSNFIAFSFQDKEIVQQIVSNFKYFDNSVVLTIHQESLIQHHFRLLWLPPLFEISRVHHLLNRFTKSHRLKRESIGVGDGVFSPTNIVSGTLTLEPGGDVNDLPHLIQLPLPHKGCALLTINSRPPLCLKCRAVGHTRNKCSMIKCSNCSKVHFPEATCGTSSYSSVAAKHITKCKEEDWLSRLANDNIISDDSNFSIISPTSQSDSGPNAIIQASSNKSDNIVSPTITYTSQIINDKTSKCDHTPLTTTDANCTALQDMDSPSSLDPHLILHPSSVHSTKEKIKHKSALTIPESKNPESLPVSESSFPSSTPSTKAHFSKNKSYSKVRITSHDDLSSTTARSNLIPYTTFQDYFVSANLQASSTADTLFTRAFSGDPDLDHPFSSDSDASDTHDMSLDFHDASSLDPLSRKRKGSSLSNEDDNILCEATLLSNKTPDLNSLPVNNAESTINNQSTDMPSKSSTSHTPSVLKSEFSESISSLFAVSEDQVSSLVTLCPNGVITSNTFKVLKLLFSHGFAFAQIIASPQVLKFRLSDLKRKIKSLESYLGVFKLEDIYIQDRIEQKIDNGAAINPTGLFS